MIIAAECIKVNVRIIIVRREEERGHDTALEQSEAQWEDLPQQQEQTRFNISVSQKKQMKCSAGEMEEELLEWHITLG